MPNASSGSAAGSGGCLEERHALSSASTAGTSAALQQSALAVGASTPKPTARACDVTHDSSGRDERTGMPNGGAEWNQLRPLLRQP